MSGKEHRLYATNPGAQKVFEGMAGLPLGAQTALLPSGTETERTQSHGVGRGRGDPCSCPTVSPRSRRREKVNISKKEAGHSQVISGRVSEWRAAILSMHTFE